jgi:guanylate kinase
MIIVLVGESGCGKSTVENIFHERNPTFHKVISYTTRPKRQNEQDDVDYHFITIEEFDRLREEGAFIETAQYRDWKYGSAKDDYAQEGNCIAVLTPHGCRTLKRWAETQGIEVVSIYINVDRRSRLIKNLNRGDNIEEAYRRSLSDVGQFDGFEDEADFTINNEGYKKDPEEIYQELVVLLWNNYQIQQRRW